MSDDFDDFLDKLRTAIEGRVRKQISRHLRVSPSIDPRKAVDIQIEQEREKLHRMADRYDDQEKADLAAEAPGSPKTDRSKACMMPAAHPTRAFTIPTIGRDRYMIGTPLTNRFADRAFGWHSPP